MKPDLADLKILPFGAQYYRAPTPEPSEWKSDMAAMRRAGFNTIKIWAQWRWNQPREDGFDFSDLDQLMDLAHEAGLGVVINTILDCAPAWLYRKYPDCTMLSSRGERVGPTILGHRQIGGAPGPCFHHPKAMELLGGFVAEVVRRYAGHPALLLWDLWNEPELTVGLLREARVENLVCYCENSRAAFVEWLEKRYGSIDGLNAAWHRNYGEWDDLELPVHPGSFKDMVDWRTFFVDTITANMEYRARITREIDRAHPVMCHTVPTPHFNPVTCGSDEWELSRCCDLFGNSVGSDPLPADIMRSAARGKMVINAEIHAIPGGTFYRPNPIGFEEMKRHLLIPLAHGIKGFLFWQYRPEVFGAECPAWGMTYLDGRPAPWLESVSRIGEAIVSNSDFFLKAERERPQVALFASPSNEVFCWAASGSTRLYNLSLSGAYGALHRANYSIDFIHPSDVLRGILDEHRILYMPLPYWVDANVLDRIREWVKSGGNLISECFLGGIDVATGYHAKAVPGGGLDKVFGVREGLVYPESGVLNSYAWKAEGAAGYITLSLARDIGGLASGTQAPGFHVGAALVGPSAEVLAHFPTGEAAVTTARYGSGTATMIGTMLGAAYAERSSPASADLLAGLVEMFCTSPIPSAGPARAVRVDILTGAGRRWIMLSNLTDAEVDAAVTLPFPLTGPPVEMFTGEAAQLSDGRMHTRLLPSQIKAFWG